MTRTLSIEAATQHHIVQTFGCDKWNRNVHSQLLYYFIIFIIFCVKIPWSKDQVLYITNVPALCSGHTVRTQKVFLQLVDTKSEVITFWLSENDLCSHVTSQCLVSEQEKCSLPIINYIHYVYFLRWEIIIYCRIHSSLPLKFTSHLVRCKDSLCGFYFCDECD